MQALLVVDIVQDIFELPVPLYDAEGFVERVCGLLARARAARIPIIHFRPLGNAASRYALGRPGRELHPRTAAVEGELVLDKREPDTFMATPLAEVLAQLRVDEVVICGFASEACVDTTVRSAFAKGFKVVLAADAHTTTANPVLSADQIIQHHNFVLKRFARVVPAAEVRFEAQPTC